MKTHKLVRRNLLYYWKQNIGVFLTIIISTSVLTGALIVGDSVRLSLKKQVSTRLGNIEFAIVTGERLISDRLSIKISEEQRIKTSSILNVQGIAINQAAGLKLNKIEVLGIESDFWDISNVTINNPVGNKIIVSKNLANRLNLNIGDNILLKIPGISNIPANAPFSDDEEKTISIRAEIIAIANDNQLGKFSLKNNQISPFNVFIDRTYLQNKLGLKDRSNLIVTEQGVDQQSLESSLNNNFEISDAAIEIFYDSNIINIKSNRIFIEDNIINAVKLANVKHENILTYFVNSFDHSDKQTPYSFISAIPPSFLNRTINDGEIIINSWLADDLKVVTGDSITINYYVIGPLRDLEEKKEVFVVKEIIPITENPTLQSLMPDFPGISTSESCSDWDAGIPIDLKRIRSKDELYWDNYKGTPKAYISLNKGISLWQNKYGKLTSIRIKTDDVGPAEVISRINESLLPIDFGIQIINVKTTGIEAASNGVDFGELFLSLSFFIIVAALILAVLIHKLNIENRKREIRTLKRLGFTSFKIIKINIYESIFIIIPAILFGGALSIYTNNLILHALNSIWSDAINQALITIFVLPKTIILGMIVGFIISLLTIYFVTKQTIKRTVSNTTNQTYLHKKTTWIKFGLPITISIYLCSVLLVVYSIILSTNIDSSLVLSAGFLFLIGSITATDILFRKIIHNNSLNLLNTKQLALKNTVRNKNRSLAVISLLALGTFTIIVTGSNRLTFSGQDQMRKSGTGGFNQWIETTIPITKNLNNKDVRREYGIDFDKEEKVNFLQFLGKDGDDASCLNLNQIQKPAIIGVDNKYLDSIGAFSFATYLKKSAKPWLMLSEQYGKNIIPAIADQTVIQWGLIKSIGDTLEYINEEGDTLKLLLVAGLAPSIFQGNILISDSNFLINFPSFAGSRKILAEIDSGSEEDIKKMLERTFQDYGIEVTSTTQRLKSFYAVTNTYLSIFMLLGGLGVVLGTIGLAIVLIRNIIDRKGEIANYMAIGFNNYTINKTIILENAYLLITGMLIGLISALIGIIPSFISQSFEIAGSFLVIILFAVLLSGLIWITVATLMMVKTISINELRSE